MSWLPGELLTADTVPREARLPLRYRATYYGTAKALFTAYSRWPINDDVAWTAGSDWDEAFAGAGAPWHDPVDDATFAALRTSGPNPWTLRADPTDPHRFVADLGAPFASLVGAAEAVFSRTDHGLAPSSITIGDVTVSPGDPRWDEAKLLFNALDARGTVFVSHLLFTHLLVGEAFAIGACQLPEWHALRPFVDFFTYGTLDVNDLAYRSLLMPVSYFVRSRFLSRAEAEPVIRDSIRAFDFSRWLPLVDIDRRGLAALDDDAYAYEAPLIWRTLADFVDTHLDRIGLDDAAVRRDADLIAWHASIRRILPTERGLPALDSYNDLRDLLTAMIFNNVIHEICGDVGSLLGRDEASRRTIDLGALREAWTTGAPPPPPRANDVLLMDQGAYASTINVGGNNLLDLLPARYVDDPRLERGLGELQAALRDLDADIVARNATRRWPVRGLEPHRWEASISF